MKALSPGKLVIGLIVALGAASAAYYAADKWTSDTAPSATAGLEASAPAAVVVASMPIKPVEKLEVDLEQQRVLVPGEGWLSAQAFWDVYYTEPQRLPGDIDFELLREFEDLTLAQRAQAERNAFPPEPVAEADEPLAVDDPLAPDDPLAAQ